MKIKEGYILSTVAGENIVLPTGDDLDLNRMITLNETGRFLWEQLQGESSPESLTERLLAEYEVDEATARGAVDRFLEKLRENDLLD